MKYVKEELNNSFCYYFLYLLMNKVKYSKDAYSRKGIKL
jgi:hypothetical protein